MRIKLFSGSSVIWPRVAHTGVKTDWEVSLVKDSRTKVRKIFCKELKSKYFVLMISILTNQLCHRRYVNKLARLCYNKTLFTKASCGPDLAHQPYFVDPCPRTSLELWNSINYFSFHFLPLSLTFGNVSVQVTASSYLHCVSSSISFSASLLHLETSLFCFHL